MVYYFNDARCRRARRAVVSTSEPRSSLRLQAAQGAESMKIGYDGRTRAALLQGPAEDSPETFDEPCAAGGVGSVGGLKKERRIAPDTYLKRFGTAERRALFCSGYSGCW